MAEQQVISVEQRLMQFVSGQIKTMASEIAKETASESTGLKARQLVAHTEELDKAIASLFAESSTSRGRRRGQ